jgi:hypothetical protein
MKLRDRSLAHKPSTLSNHQQILSKVIKKYTKRDFLLSNTLEWKADPALKIWILDGELIFKNSIVMNVSKELEIIDDAHKVENARVQTVMYTYNVRQRLDIYERRLFRYECTRELHHHCHNDTHHCHEYDTANKPIRGQLNCSCGGCPTWIGKNHWPHLSDVIEEIEEWWYNHN